MQAPNWNDLRYLLAISRTQRLTLAARRLGVDDTTVSRRLAAVQTAVGRRLYQRLSDGRFELTVAGASLVQVAERTERELAALNGKGGTAGDAAGDIAGVVRLTAVPYVMNRILIPRLAELAQRHPALRLELVSDLRDLSLTRRETDMALRFARPQRGGHRVKAQCVGRLAFGIYVSANLPAKERQPARWITYDEAMSHLPQARWLEAAARKPGEPPAPFCVNDVEAAHEAAAAGCGRTLLPVAVAKQDPRLKKLPAPRELPLPARELWLLVPRELAALPRTQVVRRWVEKTLSASKAGTVP
ncbi:LysR family transcriptional regulator [Pelagibius sp.]|uniref:LysR family transcriptional regulator n=1 Tax=Pelagibius sp. TaxID=1931238 RepID=UPI002622CA26|nr:LysR family transcriptional regulator [Pelagibius sp.]